YEVPPDGAGAEEIPGPVEHNGLPRAYPVSCGGRQGPQHLRDDRGLTMKTSWRSASLVASAAAVLALTT
ncbi:hypothetical protein GTW46_26495, partial [Streptomyces sp. SID6013]|nr:hypothetical protein [Streptomyces sp. SID6013]